MAKESREEKIERKKKQRDLLDAEIKALEEEIEEDKPTRIRGDPIVNINW